MSKILKRKQLVFLGAGQVGKTSILQRFLHGTFCTEHKETVEELYCRDFNKDIKVNFLDTAGSIAFPAMREIYIRRSDAFVFVYSITSRQSFQEVKEIWNDVKMVRKNHEYIPCVVVGNKLDCENDREVENFEALNWATSEMLGGVFLEVSAKRNRNVDQIFKYLFDQLSTPRPNLPDSLTFLTERIGSATLDDTDDDLDKEPNSVTCIPLFPKKKKSKKKSIVNECNQS